MAENNCKVISIANQKGGVAKTTTTLNLGVCLAKHGARVLMIDADYQGSLSISAGLDNPDNLENTITEFLSYEMTGDKRFFISDKDLIIRNFEGVDLIPANITLAGLEVEMDKYPGKETILKRSIEQIRDAYDFILIDCAPSLTTMTVNALTASDSVLIPFVTSKLSKAGMQNLFNRISQTKRVLNPMLRVEGMVATMVDSRTNNSKLIMDSVKSEIGGMIKVFDTVIPRSVKAEECPNYGESIFKHDPKGTVADAYERLTQEVMNREREKDPKSRCDSVR